MLLELIVADVGEMVMETGAGAPRLLAVTVWVAVPVKLELSTAVTLTVKEPALAKVCEPLVPVVDEPSPHVIAVLTRLFCGSEQVALACTASGTVPLDGETERVQLGAVGVMATVCEFFSATINPTNESEVLAVAVALCTPAAVTHLSAE